MAMIDYGAIVKINGTVVNRNELFAPCPDWVPEKVSFTDKNGDTSTLSVKGNFFAYVGDAEFFICFYKCTMLIITGDQCLKCFSNGDDHAQAEVFFLDDKRVYLDHIDKNLMRGVKMKFTIKDGEWLEQRTNRVSYKERTRKYIAKWEYKGNKYEVVFGYGIDSNKDTYNEIKYNYYDYTKVERDFLDTWY